LQVATGDPVKECLTFDEPFIALRLHEVFGFGGICQQMVEFLPVTGRQADLRIA
jgi:hypothetical protein